MEPKTIGKFITTLRKANGMTQKELAEKLNVSDKTVSRWERDDGAPDLSVIPVIAEIFGVTCDELLRGERKKPTERAEEPVEEPTAKGEKQRKRILSMGLSNYRNQTYITMGISAVGLISAMICNLGFLRANIGFFVGTIFYVGSVVLQAICTNGTFQSVSDDSIPEEDAAAFKTSVIYLCKRAITVTAVLMGATVPLIVFPNDTYMGLEAGSWLLTGLLFGAIGFVGCQVAWFFLHARLIRGGIVAMGEKEQKSFWHNQKIKRNCAIVLTALILVTSLAQISFNEMNPAWRLAQGTEFSDYESFVEYMEQDIEPDYYGSNVAPAPDNSVSEEDVHRSEVWIYDGTDEGKVVCTYIHRNGSVRDIKTSDTEDGLPITVVTYGDYRTALQKVNMINIGFAMLYAMECLVAVLVYRKKRMK